MQGLLFGLLTYFGWGTGDIFGTIASRKIGAYSTTFWVLATGWFLFTLYVPFALHELQNITLPLLITTLVLGFFYVSGNLAINEAFRRSNPSLIGTINGAFPALVIILSILFLRESITLLQAIIIFFIFLGVFLCTFDFSIVKKGKLVVDAGIFYALYAMCSFAIFFTFIKPVTQQIGWFWPLYIPFLMFPFVGLYMRKKNIPLKKLNTDNALWPVVLSALLLRSGDFVFNFSLSNGYTSIVAPIAGAYPTLFAILAFFIFEDPIKKQQVAGIFITLIGIVCLSLLSL